jgi:hypothetical protein
MGKRDVPLLGACRKYRRKVKKIAHRVGHQLLARYDLTHGKGRKKSSEPWLISGGKR